MNQQQYIYYASIGNGKFLAIPAKDDDEVNNFLVMRGLTAKRIWMEDYSE